MHSGLGAALKPLGRHRDDALNGQGQRVIAALHNMMHAAASFGKPWRAAYHDAAVKTGSGFQVRAAVRSLRDADMRRHTPLVVWRRRAVSTPFISRRGLGAALKPLGRHRDDALHDQSTRRVIAVLHNMMHGAASFGKALACGIPRCGGQNAGGRGWYDPHELERPRSGGCPLFERR